MAWTDARIDDLVGRLDTSFQLLHEEIRGFRQEVREDIHDLRAEMRGEIGEMRSEIGGLRREMRGEIGGLRGEIGGLRGEMGADMRDLRGEVATIRRDMFLGSVAVTTALIGMIATLVATHAF